MRTNRIALQQRIALSDTHHINDDIHQHFAQFLSFLLRAHRGRYGHTQQLEQVRIEHFLRGHRRSPVRNGRRSRRHRQSRVVGDAPYHAKTFYGRERRLRAAAAYYPPPILGYPFERPPGPNIGGLAVRSRGLIRHRSRERRQHVPLRKQSRR